MTMREANAKADLVRRNLLKVLGAAGTLAALPGCASSAGGAAPKVVIVGGGFGGATTAKYIRMWSGGAIEVTLIEPDAEFVSCPMSNLVIGGSQDMAFLTASYDELSRRHGVVVVHDAAIGVDAEARKVKLERGGELAYDRVILSPGVEFIWSDVPGLDVPSAQAALLHAWKAGPQTLALRRQLEAMPDGGVCAISIPLAPYRCPPGPYERACQIAWYFRRAKPKSKVLVLDANHDITSKAALFRKAWNDLYGGIVEYRPDYVLTGVDAASRTARFDVQDSVTADVLNVIPPQRAGRIARAAGVVTANDRWCEVDFLTFESIRVRNLHVLGDAVQSADLMPKSAHMANQHAKVCAAAVVALLSGRAPNPAPVLNNTCYSMLTDRDSVHVASVHQYDAAKRTMSPVPGAGGLSPAMSELEGRYAFGWEKNILADTLG